MSEQNSNGKAVQPRPRPKPPASLIGEAAAQAGQATMIEQSRAQEQVKIQALMARQFPRDEQLAERQMLSSCRRIKVAERAFFKYGRGGDLIQGPTVHLARELVRCWGNVEYGIWELARDEDKGRSEMMSWAWDLETNTRVANVAIVPHTRDVDGQVRALKQARDIYENNANMGARRLRECIFAVLPPWFTELAEDTCRDTIRNGDDQGKQAKPLDERVANAVLWFAKIGVTEAQLEARVGKPKAQWDESDAADLGVTYQSIKNHEITVGEAFEPVGVTGAEIKAQAAAGKRARRDSNTDPAADTPLSPDDPDLTEHEGQEF